MSCSTIENILLRHATRTMVTSLTGRSAYVGQATFKYVNIVSTIFALKTTFNQKLIML